MTAIYTYDRWQDALDGKAVDWPRNVAMPGFFRKDERDGTKTGVAIWPSKNDRPVVKVGKSAPRTLNTTSEEAEWCEYLFAWISKNPVSERSYRVWLDTGEWPDEVKLPDRSNSAGAPHEVIEQSIADLKAQAEAWLAEIGGEVKTQEQADKAGNYASAFAELAKEAEDKRTDAKAPVLKQGREIDGLWNPIKAAGDKAKTWAKKLAEPFLKADQARKFAEAAQAAAAGEEVRASDLKVKAGTSGRSTSLRMIERAQVTDYDAAFAHYAGTPRFKAHDMVRAAIDRLAEADLKAGHAVPGASLQKIQSAA